MEDSNQGTKRA